MHSRISSRGDTPRSESLLEMEDVVEEATATGPSLEMNRRARFGYLAQYLAVGLIYGGLPATTYGLLVGYLNVPSFVYATCSTILTLPWSFKFLFGAINDCLPIFGYRRKPYMAMGWAFCAAMLIILWLTPLPEPYYCKDEHNHAYLTDEEPCNPEAAQQGGKYCLLMMLAALGYVVADVAADGLTVQYARSEPEDRRGHTQTTAYMTRTFGQISSYCLVGLGMNSWLYLGTFHGGLSFNQICLIFAIPSAAMAPISWLCIEEPPIKERTTPSAYAAATWQMLRSRAFFCVLLFQFLNPGIQYVQSTGTVYVQRYWAEVQALQSQLFNIVSYAIFSGGIYLVRERARPLATP